MVQRGSEVGQRIGNPQQYKAAATQGTTAEHSQFMNFIIKIVAVWELLLLLNFLREFYCELYMHSVRTCNILLCYPNVVKCVANAEGYRRDY